MPSTQMRCRITASRPASATTALFLPRGLTVVCCVSAEATFLHLPIPGPAARVPAAVHNIIGMKVCLRIAALAPGEVRRLAAPAEQRAARRRSAIRPAGPRFKDERSIGPASKLRSRLQGDVVPMLDAFEAARAESRCVVVRY